MEWLNGVSERNYHCSTVIALARAWLRNGDGGYFFPFFVTPSSDFGMNTYLHLGTCGICWYIRRNSSKNFDAHAKISGVIVILEEGLVKAVW